MARAHVNAKDTEPNMYTLRLRAAIAAASGPRAEQMKQWYNYFWLMTVDLGKPWAWPYPDHPWIPKAADADMRKWTENSRAFMRDVRAHDFKAFARAWSKHPVTRTRTENETILRTVRFVRKMERYMCSSEGFIQAFDWKNEVHKMVYSEEAFMEHSLNWPCVFRPILSYADNLSVVVLSRYTA